ncbi:efflux RND transporter periplasmic adaptor subunit [Pseudomonas putida]|uniref:efflux RND transporter periplasmic adaptor subunit n=1 Tax=Pseudomonas putida TaxID=303 RepID=UPI00383BBCB1
MKPRTQKNAIALASAALLAGSAWLTLCDAAPGSATPPPTAAAPQVNVAQVLRRQVQAWDEFSARLEAVEQVEVRSRVAGQVQALHFREGQQVSKGDLLVTLDPALYATEVSRTEAQLAAARARQVYTRNEAQRAERLADSQAIARSEVERRQNEAQQAEAGLLEASAALRNAQLNLEYTQIRAQVAGRVGRREVTVGNLVSAGPDGPVLTRLVSTSPIYASFDVDEATLQRALGQQARLDAIQSLPVRMQGLDGRQHDGQVRWLDNRIDSASGTLRLRAVFDNTDGRLMPGQFARLSLSQATPFDGLLVDERALGTDQNRRYVLVLGADNRVSYRQVTLGPRVDGLRVVSTGLQAGEQIVVDGLQRVRPGALVNPQVIPMPVAQSDSPSQPRS